VTSTTTETSEGGGESTADLGPGPTTNPTTNPGMTNTAAPTSTPPPFYILPSKDSDKCLGVFDNSGNKDTSVRYVHFLLPLQIYLVLCTHEQAQRMRREWK
jgi:hypothetical protein